MLVSTGASSSGPQPFLFFLISKVSMMAAQEYEGMKEQLDLEQGLRVKAETYAHEVISDEGLWRDFGPGNDT